MKKKQVLLNLMSQYLSQAFKIWEKANMPYLCWL